MVLARTAPSWPISRPIRFGSSKLALTPVAIITVPQGYSLPPATTDSTLSFPLTAVIGVPMTNWMPSPSQCFCTIAAMSSSIIRGITFGYISTTVTFFPRFLAATAIIRPMTPAPATTTQSVVWRAALMALPSLTVLIVKTPGSFAPSMGGTNILPPVASTKES